MTSENSTCDCRNNYNLKYINTENSYFKSMLLFLMQFGSNKCLGEPKSIFQKYINNYNNNYYYSKPLAASVI